jgi:hypothetical protein
MKPNVDDDFREFSYGALLIEMDDRLLDTGRNTISRKDIVMILRAVFGFEDTRTHRAKIEMLDAKRYVKQINKTSYRITELGYERMRLARGLSPEVAIGVPPEANTEAPVAIESTHSEVYEPSEQGIEKGVTDYLNALRRGGA